MEKRTLHARLHSAGHLIDKAMTALGYNFAPLKGYHFLDGPFVEYQGKLDGEEKETLPTRLTVACADLIASEIPTDVQQVMKPEVKAICDFDTSHLPDDEPIRLVGVAGMFCPCGGTHVKNTNEIDGIRVTKVGGSGLPILVV